MRYKGGGWWYKNAEASRGRRILGFESSRESFQSSSIFLFIKYHLHWTIFMKQQWMKSYWILRNNSSDYDYVEMSGRMKRRRRRKGITTMTKSQVEKAHVKWNTWPRPNSSTFPTDAYVKWTTEAAATWKSTKKGSEFWSPEKKLLCNINGWRRKKGKCDNRCHVHNFRLQSIKLVS